MLVGLFGPMNSGKTLVGVYILKNDFSNREPISNTKLNFKHEFFSNEEFLKWYSWIITLPPRLQRKEVKRKFEGKVWFLDEIGKINPSRSRTWINEVFNDFVTMVGKLECIVIYTSQLYESQVDKIYREQTQIIIDCQRVDDKRRPIFTLKRYLDRDIRIRLTITYKTHPPTRKRAYIDPKKYYGSYDSKELLFLDRSKIKKIKREVSI